LTSVALGATLLRDRAGCTRRADLQDCAVRKSGAKGGRNWIFVYLFAKKDRDNIDDDELRKFRMHAEDYETLTDEHIVQLLDDEDLNELCNDKAKVQE